MKRTLYIIVSIILVVVLFGAFRMLPKDEVQKPIVINTEKIRIDYPRPDQTISSPLIIRGEARGNWYFEASFPVVLTDWDGKIIAQGIATAKSDWMTNDFVPFEATLTFVVDEMAHSNRGFLILKKDNPSGLPEHDDSLEIPVVFAQAKENAKLYQKIEYNGVHVTPMEVVSDSRCPVDVNCVWAGEILVKIKLEKGTTTKVVELKEGESSSIDGSTVTLTNVLPEKQSTVTTQNGDYRFTFKVE